MLFRSSTGALATQAQQVLQTAPGLDGSALTVTVKGTRASLTGDVTTMKQKKIAESALKGIPGISKVDASGVKLLARTKGAKHVVAKGDTLSKIAALYYGDGSLAKKIASANKSLNSDGDLKVGETLTIPAIQ